MKSIIDFRGSNLQLLSSLKFPSLKPSFDTSEQQICGVTPSNYIINNSIPLVEVVMKEMEDISGRSIYYDQFGVIRDVMQNHLTQALVYSLMDLSQDAKSEEKETFGKLFI